VTKTVLVCIPENGFASFSIADYGAIKKFVFVSPLWVPLFFLLELIVMDAEGSEKAKKKKEWKTMDTGREAVDVFSNVVLKKHTRKKTGTTFS
jgi:hypothetical protein